MRYRATTEWVDGWWAIRVLGHPGVWTQSRRLDQVPQQAADALSLAIDAEVSPEDIEIVVAPLTPNIAVALEAKSAAEAAATRASSAMRAAVADLTTAGLSVRDVGNVMRISHQRAAVLAREVAHRRHATAATRRQKKRSSRK